MDTSTISTGIVGTRIAAGNGSSGRRARGKRSKAAQSASLCSSIPVVSPLVSESGGGGVKDALSSAVDENPSGILEAVGAFPCDFRSFSKSCDSEVSGDSQVQKLPASGSSSELSAHQMPPGGGTSALAESSRTPAHICSYWFSASDSTSSRGCTHLVLDTGGSASYPARL